MKKGSTHFGCCLLFGLFVKGCGLVEKNKCFSANMQEKVVCYSKNRERIKREFLLSVLYICFNP